MLLTGEFTQAAQQRARQAGALATLTNPFSTMKLLQTVTVHTREHKNPSSSTPDPIQ
ncbi:MAG: hypothetical protein NPIRA04_26200 [Nitrospirales bacterium]|nr:MAG: hypothetical protein NPIRA04_26200 [Nitrospirales bacterium]